MESRQPGTTVGDMNSRGEMLVEFAERNQLRATDTFFKKRKNRKWTWKSPNGERENEIDFILSSDSGIVQNTEVVNKVKISDHILVGAKITLNPKRTRIKLLVRKQDNLDAVGARTEEFKIALKKKYEVLGQEENEDIERT